MDFKNLEVFHELAKKDLQSKDDCAVVIIHVLLLNKGLKCVGIGDEWPEDNERSSELLPASWNRCSDISMYSLRYISSSGKKYLLKIGKLENNHHLMVNFLNVTTDRAAGMSVDVDRHISGTFREFSENYLDLDIIDRDFSTQIESKVLLDSGNPKNPNKDNKSDNPGSISPTRQDEDNDIHDPSSSSGPSGLPPWLNDRPGLPPIGSRDLDPFARGPGGGMLLDPSMLGRPRGPPDYGAGIPGGLPTGSVPPGARFDPFAPPGVGRSRGRGRSLPDPDHFDLPDDVF